MTKHLYDIIYKLAENVYPDSIPTEFGEFSLGYTAANGIKLLYKRMTRKHNTLSYKYWDIVTVDAPSHPVEVF